MQQEQLIEQDFSKERPAGGDALILVAGVTGKWPSPDHYLMVDKGLPEETTNSLEEPEVEEALSNPGAASKPCDSTKNMATQGPKQQRLDWKRALQTEDGDLGRKSLQEPKVRTEDLEKRDYNKQTMGRGDLPCQQFSQKVREAIQPDED